MNERYKADSKGMMQKIKQHVGKLVTEEIGFLQFYRDQCSNSEFEYGQLLLIEEYNKNYVGALVSFQKSEEKSYYTLIFGMQVEIHVIVDPTSDIKIRALTNHDVLFDEDIKKQCEGIKFIEHSIYMDDEKFVFAREETFIK